MEKINTQRPFEGFIETVHFVQQTGFYLVYCKNNPCLCLSCSMGLHNRSQSKEALSLSRTDCREDCCLEQDFIVAQTQARP